MNRERVLRGALERDDGEMSASVEVLDVEGEPDSRLTADQSLGRGARRATWPSRSWFKARRPGRWTPMIVDLVRGRGSESGVRPVAAIPGEVKPELLLEISETVWNRDQPSSALGLDRPDATLDDGEAAHPGPRPVHSKQR